MPPWKTLSIEVRTKAPSSRIARMFSIVWETIVPITTGNVSLARPVWRARLIALAGSPRRAGKVADISTPIIVAEAKSRRLRPEWGIADRAMKNQDQARTKSEDAIRARAKSTQERSERTTVSATWSTPIFLAATAVRPSPNSAFRPRPALRTQDRRGPVPSAGAGSSEGSLTAGAQGSPSEGATPSRRRIRSLAASGSGTSIARS